MKMIEFTNDDGVRYVTEVPDDFPDDGYSDEQMQFMLDKARVESQPVSTEELPDD